MEQQAPGPNGNVYLVSAARTPIGKFGGALVAVPATELGGGRDPRGGGAVRPPVGRAGRRGHHGPGPAGRRGPGPGAPGAARRGPRRHDLGDDDQPRLRLGPQGDHVLRGLDQGGRRRGVRRGRHGVDEQRAVPAAQGALRLPARQRRRSRTRGARRAVVRDRGLPHGHPRGARGDQGPRVARGPGRVRATRATGGPSTRSTPAGSTPRWRR